MKGDMERFWDGSLTWILDKEDEKKEFLMSMLAEEFKALDALYKYDVEYCRPHGIVLCGYHYTCILRVLGWNDWESVDIHSFHINCTRKERDVCS